MVGAGVGDQDVEAAVAAGDRIDAGARGHLVRDIKRLGINGKSALAQRCGARRQAGRVAAVDDHRGAGLGQRLGHCRTETARCAGDKGNLPGERKHRVGHGRTRAWLRRRAAVRA